MKKSLVLIMLAALCTTCTKTEVACSDPAGTVTVSIPNNQFFCFKDGALAGINNCGLATGLCCSDIQFYPNNFRIGTSVIAVETSTTNGIITIRPITGTSSIATTGAVSRLCDIKAVPSSGFVPLMAADYNIGYVIKLADGTYAKFIVKGFGTFTTGGVSSVQISYQYPFK